MGYSPKLLEGLFCEVELRLYGVLRSWSAVSSEVPGRPLLSPTQDSARDQQRVRCARRRQDRYRDEHPEARVAATALLLAPYLAVVGGAGHPRLGLDHRQPFLRYPPRVGQRLRLARSSRGT